MSYVGCHLRNDGNIHATFDISREEGYQFGVLTHIGAHTRLTHLGAGIVQFYSIATGFLCHLGQLNPVFFVLSHDRSYDNLRRVILFESLQDIEIYLYGILAQLFHITEGKEVAVPAIIVNSIKAR